MPLATDAAKQLREVMGIDAKLLEKEIARLSTVYRFAPEEFETVLMALSESDYLEEKLTDQLQKMYRHSFVPLLHYEILAHMLKHRFLDAIINFNFDELLDQAIRDEVGVGQFHHVVSDGDCAGLQKYNERFAMPLYVKPHGTASHRSTLRYTREAYYGMPSEMHQLLDSLLTGLPVTLITVGFGMKSFEFNHLLRKVAPGSQAFHINKSEVDKAAGSMLDEQWIDIGSSSLAEVFKGFWEQVQAVFLDEFRPRNVLRHRFVASLFSERVSPDRTRYLADRTLLELAFSVAKSRGLVSVTQLARERAGGYYDQYVSAMADSAQTPAFFELCNWLGLREESYGRQVWRLQSSSGSASDESLARILGRDEFTASLDGIADSVKGHLSQGRVQRFEKLRDDFKATLEGLYQSEEVEIVEDDDRVDGKMFKSAKPLKTDTALRFHTRALLQRPGYQWVFAVAETGKWLLQSWVKDLLTAKTNVRIGLVLADDRHKSKIQQLYQEKIAFAEELPWWEHNRHMTLIVRGQVPLGGIYFSRRLRSSRITPLLLNDADSSIMLDTFVAYYKKATEAKERERWISLEEAQDRGAFFATLSRRDRGD